MKKLSYIIISVVTAIMSIRAYAQAVTSSNHVVPGTPGLQFSPVVLSYGGPFAVDPPAGDEKKRDASYQLYKKGYNLVLEEEWQDAQKTLAEVKKQYPKSEYVDDAEYWTAFALKHTDKKKAKEAYRKFIVEYPTSSYYDDAIADYADLNKGHAIGVGMGVGEDGKHVFVLDGERLDGGAVLGGDSDSSLVISSKNGKMRRKTGKGGWSYSYAFAPTMRQTEHQMRMAERQLQRQLGRISVKAPKAYTLMPRIPGDDEKLDSETKLKMDALYALGDTKEDSVSYRTLRDVAVDRTQPRELRESAMDALSNFTQIDVLPVFLEVAKKDTNEEIQDAAIDYMGQLAKDKNRSVETLTELFSAIPNYRNEQRHTVLSSIAEIGNDRAVEFLAEVARAQGDYELRSDAIYYLGNIGGEKARHALYDILKGKEK